jgi:hypothetical protein
MSDWKGFKHRVKIDGDYDGVDNKDPSSSGLIASDRAAVKDKTTMNKRPSAVDGQDDVTALDVAIRHSDGDRISEEQPLPVYQTESPGDEIDDYDNAAAVAEDASANHDYTVSAAKTLKEVKASGSSTGFAAFELQVETAAASGVFNTVMKKFNSVSNPNVEFSYKKRVETGVIVRLVKTNCDDDDTDLHSQIQGIEV